MIDLNLIVILTLVALLIGSNIYWAFMCLKLTNRIMSKNYGELKQAENKPKLVKEMPVDQADPIAERHAREMNAVFAGI